MRWLSIVLVAMCMMNCFGLPKAIVIHCGGNDIGSVSTGWLYFHLKFALYMVDKMCLGSNIMYSSVDS